MLMMIQDSIMVATIATIISMSAEPKSKLKQSSEKTKDEKQDKIN